MGQIDIVVPDGSMQEMVMSLLAKAGLPITVAKKRLKEGKVDAKWIKRIAFQKPREIPYYLARGHFDVAIVGEDWIADSGCNFPVLLKITGGRSGTKAVKIVLATKMDNDIEVIEDLPKGCEVATEYVKLTERFFAARGRKDIIVTPSYGNTEHKIEFGATAIVELTETGESLDEHRLGIISEIMESQTVIIANENSLADKSKLPYINCFVQLVKGAYQASQYVMITANVPESVRWEASRIIGGLKGPSCSVIGNGWLALQSVILKSNEQDVIFKLLQIGVTDIVVIREIPMMMS